MRHHRASIALVVAVLALASWWGAKNRPVPVLDLDVARMGSPSESLPRFTKEFSLGHRDATLPTPVGALTTSEEDMLFFWLDVSLGGRPLGLAQLIRKPANWTHSQYATLEPWVRSGRLMNPERKFMFQVVSLDLAAGGISILQSWRWDIPEPRLGLSPPRHVPMLALGYP